MSRKYRMALIDSMMANGTEIYVGGAGGVHMEVSENDGVRAVWHYRRPYTVCILYDENASAFGIGVAKVCWPDVWKPMIGKIKSLGKAAEDLDSSVFPSGHVPFAFADRGATVKAKDAV